MCDLNMFYINLDLMRVVTHVMMHDRTRVDNSLTGL